MRPLTAYLVESYCADPDGEAAELLRLASEPRTATWPGVGVGYRGCIAVPGDEVALHLFDGIDTDAVLSACRDAGIRCDRIVSITAYGPPTLASPPPATPTEIRR